ncbi:hypothetical protein ACLKA6_019273 [Drosophila palustris]
MLIIVIPYFISDAMPQQQQQQQQPQQQQQQQQAPRFTTHPSSSGSIVSEGRTKILQCLALAELKQLRRKDMQGYCGKWHVK